MRRRISSMGKRMIPLLLVMSFALPQATCTVAGPPGSTLVIDSDAALVVADLIRDIVFIREVDDDFFDDYYDDDHHHYFFW